MTRECANCNLLTKCRDVNEKRLEDHYKCRLFQPASDAELGARADIIRDLGLWALRYEVPHLKRPSARPKFRRRKRHV
jgi:hypothetical protein